MANTKRDAGYFNDDGSYFQMMMNGNQPKKKAKIEEIIVGKAVTASHCLVKHSGSRRPSSHRETKITRSKEEAIAKLENLKERLLKEVKESSSSGKDQESKVLSTQFRLHAEAESDCSSYKKGGSLGRFGRGKMQKPFEEAAFKLKPGELSEVVETESGVHLILVEDMDGVEKLGVSKMGT